MKLTEADARLRWCPLTRTYAFAIPTAREGVVPTATGGPANRYVTASGAETNPENCRCLASQCMMWVWIGPPPDDPARRLGCCGLAYDRN